MPLIAVQDIGGAGDLISFIRTGELIHFGSGILIAAGFTALLCLPQVRRRVH